MNTCVPPLNSLFLTWFRGFRGRLALALYWLGFPVLFRLCRFFSPCFVAFCYLVSCFDCYFEPVGSYISACSDSFFSLCIQ
ncbi:MAG: hypothetical protein [Microviridae sp.]|nr:MAG: hypothetical protein [Microviridae sp.]